MIGIDSGEQLTDDSTYIENLRMDLSELVCQVWASEQGDALPDELIRRHATDSNRRPSADLQATVLPTSAASRTLSFCATASNQAAVADDERPIFGLSNATVVPSAATVLPSAAASSSPTLIGTTVSQLPMVDDVRTFSVSPWATRMPSAVAASELSSIERLRPPSRSAQLSDALASGETTANHMRD